MSIHDKLVDVVTTHLPTLKPTPSGWKKANCPMCIHRGHSADRRERFGVLIQHDGLGMNCFNCGYGTQWHDGQELSQSFKLFLSAVGLPQNDIDALSFETYLQRHQIQRGFSHTVQGSVTSRWTHSKLPPDTHSVQWWADQGCDDPAFLGVAAYAMDRCLWDLTRVAWSPSTKRQMNRRLLVPFYHRDHVVGFTGRMASSNVDKRLRYYHEIPPGYIFNLDRQQDYDRKYTIIVEGAFDALLVDGVALLHDKCNADQIQLINNLHTIPVVCPDRDRDGDTLIEIAAQQGWYVSFPKWKPHMKDPTDAAKEYGALYTIHSILQNITNDPDKIRLWRKLDSGAK